MNQRFRAQPHTKDDDGKPRVLLAIGNGERVEHADAYTLDEATRLMDKLEVAIMKARATEQEGGDA